LNIQTQEAQEATPIKVEVLISIMKK